MQIRPPENMLGWVLFHKQVLPLLWPTVLFPYMVLNWEEHFSHLFWVVSQFMEIIGPALLQSALQKAGEVPSNNTEEEGTQIEIDINDSTSDFTDVQLHTYATKFKVCSMYIIKDVQNILIEEYRPFKINNMNLPHYWKIGPSMLADIDNEVETFPVNLYVELEEISFSKMIPIPYFNLYYVVCKVSNTDCVLGKEKSICEI